ncbi:Antitoxin of toxin-antitoxin, RelE / RelB, TA system [Paramicrobacterium humi]|uniref:Antitoxin of toxin-antitoxin, RelE / RelB, TA system n=1 Tax=Paramicrobacterium humi TaxID=640635 RepID=A0A1H4L1U8_9MICO|nr:hypothetical protein [Microbacterium humi]SEB64693.1 Antitoxin of toxin-antitoxin, RelE / RelB, TA system [Microbacterium humi]
MHALDYPSFTSAREHLKTVFDAAERGHIVTVARSRERFAITSVERLRDYLAKTVEPRLRVGKAEDTGTWVASMDSRPFIAEGADAEDAIDGLVEELREYAEDFDEHFSGAANHKENWGLVQLVRFSSDEQLKAWLRS